jgi:hypothetical protein
MLGIHSKLECVNSQVYYLRHLSFPLLHLPYPYNYKHTKFLPPPTILLLFRNHIQRLSLSLILLRNLNTLPIQPVKTSQIHPTPILPKLLINIRFPLLQLFLRNLQFSNRYRSPTSSTEIMGLKASSEEIGF